MSGAVSGRTSESATSGGREISEAISGASLAALALGLLLVGCAAPAGRPSIDERPAGSAPKRIVAAIASNPVAPNRQIAGIPPGADVVEELVNVGLGHIDNSGSLRPQLAEEIPTLDNGQWRLLPGGRMEMTWRLKRNTVWHDGAPFTADDLVFTAQVNVDPDIEISKPAAWGSVDTLEALDSHTVLIKWKRVFFEADLLLTTFSQARALPMPKHLLEPTYRDNKEGFLRLPYWTSEHVGTGPFRVTQWQEGSGAFLVASDSYIFGRPLIDEIEVRFIESLNTMMVNLLAGQIDVVLGRGLSLDQGVQVRDQWRDGQVDLGFVSLIAIYPQHLNPTPAIVANAQFKRALLYALDRQAMVDAIVYGLEPVADSFFAPHRPEYPFVEGSQVKYEFDPRKTELMLAELGYRRGRDGVWEDSAGQRLAVEIATGLGGEAREKSVLAIADYWQRVGVAATPAILSQQEDRDRNYRAGNQQAFYVARTPTDFPTLRKFHSKLIPLPENRFAGGNLSRYGNPQFDALLDTFEVTIPRNERMAVLVQIVQHMTSEVVVMGLFHDADVMPVSLRLSNAQAQKGIGATTAWNAHEWVVK